MWTNKTKEYYEGYSEGLIEGFSRALNYAIGIVGQINKCGIYNTKQSQSKSIKRK